MNDWWIALVLGGLMGWLLGFACGYLPAQAWRKASEQWQQAAEGWQRVSEQWESLTKDGREA